MKFVVVFVSLTFYLVACRSSDKSGSMKMHVEYPATRKDSIVDNYHGRMITDPYRWLEDDHSEETKAWVKEENAVTQKYLETIPFRAEIATRLESLWNYERYDVPFRKGGKYYFFKNDGLQNQSVLYVQDDLKDDPKVVLDPNRFSADGTVALGGISFDHDGRFLAYQTSEAGSDWHTIYVKDVVSGELLSDRIEWVKFSGVSWSGSGFYYSRFPQPDSGEKHSGQNEFHKIYYHKLGTDQDQDQLVMEDPVEPQRNFYASTTEDERFLCISIVESTSGNALYIDDLSKGGNRFVLSDKFDSDFSVVDNIGSKVFVLTNRDAPNWKLVAIDMDKPSHEEEIILAEQGDVLVSVSIIGEGIFAEYLQDAKSVIRSYDELGNQRGEVQLPAIGTVGRISGKRGERLAFFSFTNYIFPTTIYSLDTETLELTIFKSPTIDFDAADYMTKQVFYKSKDGTRVPMFITYKKGLSLDGSNPTMLYGYGGFNISLTPAFNPANLVLLENGGIYAVANLRGGGEYGKEWHVAGTKAKKQNVFDDFIAGAKFLIDSDYTSPDKLAIMGGSNGGLLVGACMTQVPNLFKVAIPRVGVLDMLRYHEFTIGWAWAEDYGRSDDADAFKYLIEYSPLHNLRETEYPATLIMTADHDDRVVPAHSFKFAAELQNKQKGNNPVLIRIDSSAGHGAGKPTTKLIEENADMFGFLFYNMGVNVIYTKMDKES